MYKVYIVQIITPFPGASKWRFPRTDRTRDGLDHRPDHLDQHVVRRSLVELWLPAGFRHALAEGRGNELCRGRADVDDRRPADPALRYAAGRIADALRSGRRTKRNPWLKQGLNCSRSLRV